MVALKIFESVVTGIGEAATEFFQAGMIVLFGNESPPELQEIAVIHGPARCDGVVRPGHLLCMAGRSYRITAVGSVAQQNLEELGHAVIKFNGREQPELPGDLCVEALEAPVLRLGDRISIELPG